jgi:signal transduction histidine kinase
MVSWGARLTARMGPRLGVRPRLVLVAVVVVLVALLAGGSGLLWALQANLERSSEASARSRAIEVVSLISNEGVAEVAASLTEDTRSGQVVQIVSSAGRVLGSSDRRASTAPLSPLRPVPGTYETSEIDIDNLGAGGDWKVISTAVQTDSATYLVYVAVPIRVQRETIQTVAIFLLGATPLLLIGVAVAVWLLVGRALQPVERIRRGVAAIDAQRLAARVEVPPTGDEIAALASTMNAMLDRLEASSGAQRAFVSDASHELRSPLATLSTAAELAAKADEPTRNRLLVTINLELSRMGALVENLMTLARADAHDLVLKPTDVDLDDLVDDEVHRLKSTSERRLVVDVQPVRVWADRQRLAQALRNLVDNAERHASTTVRLCLSTRDATAVLAVDNDGEVVDPADRERIFERFVRLDASRSRDVGGSGLGLAIARAAVRSQAGDVVAQEAPDGWCRFELSLPLGEPGPTESAVEPHRTGSSQVGRSKMGSQNEKGQP